MNIGHAIGTWADNLIRKQTIQNSDVTRLAKRANCSSSNRAGRASHGAANASPPSGDHRLSQGEE